MERQQRVRNYEWDWERIVSGCLECATAGAQQRLLFSHWWNWWVFFPALSCLLPLATKQCVFCFFFVFFFMFADLHQCFNSGMSVQLGVWPEHKKGHHHTQVQITWSPYNPCIGFIVNIKTWCKWKCVFFLILNAQHNSLTSVEGFIFRLPVRA